MQTCVQAYMIYLDNDISVQLHVYKHVYYENTFAITLNSTQAVSERSYKKFFETSLST